MVPLPHVTSITRICIIASNGLYSGLWAYAWSNRMLWKGPGPLYETVDVPYYPVVVLQCRPALRVSPCTAPSHTLPRALGWGCSSLAIACVCKGCVFMLYFSQGFIQKAFTSRCPGFPWQTVGSSPMFHSIIGKLGGTFSYTSCSLCMIHSRKAMKPQLLWKQCLWKLGPNSSTQVASFL